MKNPLRIRIKGRAPQGGFRYVFPQDGHVVQNFAYDSWLSEISQHYARNGYERPADWAEQAEDQLCRMLPPGECFFDNGEAPDFFVNRTMTLDDVVRGTKVLAAWTASGFPLVQQEIAESRAAICAACYANVPIPGCTSCTRIMELVMDAVGGKQVKSDQLLYGKSCAYCHCASSANVWVPVEVSRHGVNAEQLANMPETCWKKKDIAELAAKD